MSEADYYQAVEEFFVSKRGDPLFLSNSDWLLVHRWRRQGLPLRIVLRGIADAFEGHAHSWARERRVGSLAYCRRDVEAAGERWQRALALGEEESADPAGLLRGLAVGLERASDLGQDAERLARTTVRGLRERADSLPARRDLEAWLQEREAELLAALAAQAGPEGLAEHERAVETELAPYRERMPATVLEQIRHEARTRRLFEAHGLPRLSLFAL